MHLRFANRLSTVTPARLLKRLNTVWLLAIGDQAICSIGNFAVGVILGRGSRPEQFGLYLLAFSVLLISIDILAAFLTTPFTVSAPHLADEERHLHTGTVLLQLFFVCILFAVLMAVGSVSLRHLHNPNHYDVIARLLLIAGAPILLREGLRRISFALFDFRSALVMDVVATALQLCSLLWLRLHGVLSAATALESAGLMSAISAVVWIFLGRSRTAFSVRHLRRQSVSGLRLGGWVFSSGLLWTLLTNTYVWILSAVAGYKQSAIWGACLAITASCNPLFLGLQNYVGPRVAYARAKQPASLATVMNRQTLWFCLTLSPISLTLILFGGTIVRHVYGPNYAGCCLIMIFLALNMLASAAGFAPSRALFSLHSANLDFFVNVLSLVVAFATSVLLIRTAGVAGAAASLLVTNIVAAFARQLVATRTAARACVCAPTNPVPLAVSHEV